MGVLKGGIQVGNQLGFTMYGVIGPWPSSYNHRMCTLHVMFKSQQPGRHEEQIKFSAARWVRTVATNLDRASANRAESTQIENQLEKKLKQDLAISIEVMLELMKLFEDDYQK
jgi:hypothetical protein